MYIRNALYVCIVAASLSGCVLRVELPARPIPAPEPIDLTKPVDVVPADLPRK